MQELFLGDMLPLPLIEEVISGNGGSQRRRKGSARAATRLANGALSALNSLLGFSNSLPGAPRNGVHESIRAEVTERAFLFAPDHQNASDNISDEAALRQLLKGQSVYAIDKSGCAVKPYGSGPVSLPDNLDNCPSLESSLPLEDRHFLEGDHERMRNHNPQ